jgi:hypothetical protein
MMVIGLDRRTSGAGTPNPHVKYILRGLLEKFFLRDMADGVPGADTDFLKGSEKVPGGT